MDNSISYNHNTCGILDLKTYFFPFSPTPLPSHCLQITQLTNIFCFRHQTESTDELYHAGILSNGSKWQRTMLILFMVIISYVGPVQCFAGADVLRWRSFYATEDNAWRAHYREVFDHGIREALCCVRRVKYL